MRRQRILPIYRCPFSSAEQIPNLARRYMQIDATRTITDGQCLSAGSALLQGISERDNLRTIFRWKLEAYLHTFAWVREFPDGLTDQEIAQVIATARRATISDDRTVSHAFRILDNIPHVGVPVASAILMAMHPKVLTVIDRQAYNMLAAQFRDPIPADGYLHYLNFCRGRAASFGVTLRQYDHALWQSGSDASRRGQSC